MGNSHSGRASWLSGSSSARFHAIADQYTSVDQVSDALRREGLESSNLVVAVDFTKSNEWTGKRSYGGRSLHAVGEQPNPYERAMTVIARTLARFDDDQLIPCYGFGDASTQDRAVFSFNPGDAPCHGLDAALWRYRQLCPCVRLAGPTSFAPAIYQALRAVAVSGGQYHILLLIADGQVTRSSDLPSSQLSPQEKATVDAIVAASSYPLSIVMVGVGDGGWEQMREFDDRLPQRQFDNFQFVEMTSLEAQYRAASPAQMEAAFALRALMEIPQQYRVIQRLGLMGRVPRFQFPAPLPPPPTAPQPPAPHAPTGMAAYPAVDITSSPYPSPAIANPPSQHQLATPQLLQQQQPAHPAASGGAAVSAGGEGQQHASMFVCPITADWMNDPVVAADGYTYERAAIAEWLRTHDTSPMTNDPLSHKMLTPNHALRSAIMEARKK